MRALRRARREPLSRYTKCEPLFGTQRLLPAYSSMGCGLTPSHRGRKMISVHNIFICKPGNAGKLAKLFKEWADIKKERKMSVMTDMTGQFHRVIIAENHPSLAAY